MLWTPQLECAFASQPLSTSPVFTDITDYAKAISPVQVTFGRPDEFSEVQPSTLSVMLNNSDGRFTRDNPSSPYYPNVRNGRRVRYRVWYTPKNWVPNPTFETDILGWEPGGSVPPSLARSTVVFFDGIASLQITWGTGGLFPQAATLILGLRPGTTYTASAWLRVPSAQGGPPIKLAIGGVTVGSPTSALDTWQRRTVTFTATSFAHSLQVWPDSAPTAGGVGRVDDVQVEEGTAATTFDPTPPVVSPRFDGHVNQWPTDWVDGTGGAHSWPTITATDRMKRLAQLGELRSMLEEEILRDVAAPDATHGSAYYPLSEPAESASAGNITPQVQDAARVRQLGVGGTLSFGEGTGPGTDQMAAPVFTPANPTSDNTDGLLLDASLRTGVGGSNGVTLEGFFRVTTPLGGLRVIAMLQDLAGSTAELRITSFGRLSGAAWSSGSGAYYFDLSGGGSVADGRTHHAALTMSLSGGVVTARLFVDGAQVDVTTFAATGLATYRRLSIGGDPKAGRLWNGTLSHVAAHSAALSASRLAAHTQAGLTGMAGERTDQRVGRVADWIGLPTADRDLDVGNGTVGAQATSGQQPVEILQQTAAAESGVLFIGRDGKLVMHNRQRRYNLAPVFTLDVAQGHLDPDLAFPGDDFGMVNDMTVTRPGGASARFTDQESIDEFGLYREPPQEIPAGTDDEVSSAASWRVSTYGQPRTRISQVTVNLHDPRLSSLLPQLLAATIGTKLRLANLPAQAPASTVDVFVEGATEQTDGMAYTIQFNCSPGDIYDVWQLGVPGRSELGLTTRLAQAGATVPADTFSDVFSDTF